MIWQIYDLDYRANLFPISLSIITYFLLTIIFFIKTIDFSPIKNNLIFNFININIYEKDSKFNNQFFYYLSILSYLLNFIFNYLPQLFLLMFLFCFMIRVTIRLLF